MFRDFIAPLRRFRTCRFHGLEGACVWAALSSKDGEELVSDNRGSVLPKLDAKAPALLAQKGSFEVSTLRLDSITSRFGMKHIDFLSGERMNE
jgi:hypothetical protein